MKLKLSIWLLVFFTINIAFSGNISEDISQYKKWLKAPPSAENRSKIFNLAKEISHADPLLSNEIINLLMKKSGVQKNDSLLIHCFLAIAENHTLLNENSKASHELKQALRLAEKTNNLDIQPRILYQLGKNQTQLGQDKKAWLYYQTAQKLLPENSHNILSTKILLGQSACRLKENDPIASKIFADSALSCSIKLNNKLLIAESYWQLAKIAQSTKDFQLEKTMLDHAWMEIPPPNKNSLAVSILIFQQRNALQLEDTLSALLYLTKAIEIQDEINQTKIVNKTTNQRAIVENYNPIKTVSYFWYIVLAILISLAIFGILALIKIFNKKRTIMQAKMKALTEKEKLLNAEDIDLEEAIEQELKVSIEKIESEIHERQLNYPKLEEALEFSKQADYMKDMFLAKLSHEVRSPLTTILGFSSLLETELAMMEDPELFDFASNITQSGQSLIELLDNIFDLSLINSNKLELKKSSFDIGLLTQKLAKKFETQASQKGIRIVVSPCHIKSIESDINLIERILTMIIDNSVRFTEKGYIKVDIQLNKENNLVSILVKDTGIGIDKTYLKDVFEPYRKEKLGYSTSYQGAGLSLPLAKKMVEILGGSIKIESEKGNGTTVCINIPLIFIPFDLNKKELTLPKPSNRKVKLKKILLIEPDQLTQLIIEKLLRKSYEITPVDNKNQGATSIIELEQENQLFDLIMIDIPAQEYSMAIKDLKQLVDNHPAYVNIPIIGIVSQSLTEATNQLSANGFSTLITKPILREELENAVNNVFDIKFKKT